MKYNMITHKSCVVSLSIIKGIAFHISNLSYPKHSIPFPSLFGTNEIHDCTSEILCGTNENLTGKDEILYGTIEFYMT